MSCGKPCQCKTYRDHLLSVGIGAAALPSRKGRVIEIAQQDRALDKDAAAYRRLRKEGLQPPRVDGSHQLEARASTKAEVETGVLRQPTGG